MSNKATQQERDFAIVMQQLSAEAEKILPGDQSKSLPEVRDPAEPTGGTKRVHRGGSWKSRFSSLRTTVRSSNVPGFSCNDLGFRIVCECD